MRKFFRAHRDEDYSQIQYLTAKCTRLTHDKAGLDREFLVSRDRERKLQNDLEAMTARLLHQQQLNVELRMREDQLLSRIHQQQDQVDLLKQRVVLLAEVSCRDEELLRQVCSELLSLQRSEVKLEGLVEELHAEGQHRAGMAESLQTELRVEAQHRAALTESLQAELCRKTVELEELQDTNQTLTETLEDLRSAHHKEVRELRRENERSVKKLQGTAEQFEWLCQQQRYWMCSVKRFKDCLLEERAALLRQVIVLKTKAEKLKKSLDEESPTESVLCPLQDPTCCHGNQLWSVLKKTPTGINTPTSWDADEVADLESQVEKSNMLYAELFNQTGSPINGHQKPP